MLITIFISCTEPYALQTNTFEDVIVVEATITNEFKKQEIKLSRSYRLEDNGPDFEAGATVFVKDDLGNQYNFEENDGKYISTSEFEAIAGRNYQLHITTNDGKSYTSSNEKLTTVSPLQELIPEVVVKDGVKGVQIVAKSFDPSSTAKYYRYEYEETYKIIAPKWTYLRANALVFSPPRTGAGVVTGYVELIPRTEEARVCYTSKTSKNIILTNTSNLSEDRVILPTRFISSKDYIIMNRYSILVKQYVENLASYTYHQTLKKLSNSDSTLSQNQPGFITSNVVSTSNLKEKVLGYFSVNSYSEKRVFFNFQDIFPSEAIPLYPYDCPDPIPGDRENEFYFKYCFDPAPDCAAVNILDLLMKRKSVYYSGYPGIGTIPSGGLGGPAPTLLLYPIQCGDCTSFSNNIKPIFWID